MSPDGSTVFVTGRSDGSTTNFDYTTVAYDASTGRKLWVKRFNGPVSSNDEAKALRVSPDGSTVFVTGFSYGSTTNYDYATVAYDAFTGTKLWAIAYNGPANGVDEATALDVRPDGSIVVVTGKSEGSTRFDYATVAYGASAGTQLWVRRYNGPANGIDKAAALSGSPDGSMVFVTGLSDGSTSYDYATVAYDGATGSKLWVERYDGPLSSIDAAKALGVSPDGSTLFVTGKSFESTTHFDYATVAYDASAGTQLWATLYSSGGGPGGRTGEGARALGISPDGSMVFVTGESSGATTSYDYATVAYRTT